MRPFFDFLVRLPVKRKPETVPRSRAGVIVPRTSDRRKSEAEAYHTIFASSKTRGRCHCLLVQTADSPVHTVTVSWWSSDRADVGSHIALARYSSIYFTKISSIFHAVRVFIFFWFFDRALFFHRTASDLQSELFDHRHSRKKKLRWQKKKSTYRRVIVCVWWEICIRDFNVWGKHLVLASIN